MTRIKAGLMLLSIVLSLNSASAYAYDEDTHFYATYAMARFAGIEHDVAVKLALSAQWVDESFISDPTSMIFLTLDGMKKRRLLHFPSSRLTGSIAAKVQDESLGVSTMTTVQKMVADYITKRAGVTYNLNTLSLHTQTEPNNEFASGLLREGLREGNLMKCGASLHTIEDSYAHAGVSAEIGHTGLWHWPDRPFADTNKYFDMTRTLFQALVAIRVQLPASALDCSFSFSGAPNCQQTAEDLANHYAAIPEIRSTVDHDVLKDPDYIRTALQTFILRAIDAKYLNPSALPPGQDFNSILEGILTSHIFVLNKMDTTEVLVIYIKQLIQMQGGASGGILNVAFIPKDMGLISSANIDIMEYIKSFSTISGINPDPTGLDGFTRMIVRRILAGYVPIPLSGVHKEEMEDDLAPTRAYEMTLRDRNIRKVIKDLFKVDLQFINNNSSDDVGFGREVNMQTEAEPVIDRKNPDTVYATFTLAEKNRFDHMIFNYLYPSLGDEALKVITAEVIKMKSASLITANAEFANEVKEIWYARRFFFIKFWQLQYSTAKLAYRILTKLEVDREFINALSPYIDSWITDLATSHMAAVGDERYYQEPTLFEKHKLDVRAQEKNPGLYPQLLNPKLDVWNVNSLNLQTATLR